MLSPITSGGTLQSLSTFNPITICVKKEKIFPVFPRKAIVDSPNLREGEPVSINCTCDRRHISQLSNCQKRNRKIIYCSITSQPVEGDGRIVI